MGHAHGELPYERPSSTYSELNPFGSRLIHAAKMNEKRLASSYRRGISRTGNSVAFCRAGDRIGGSLENLPDFAPGFPLIPPLCLNRRGESLQHRRPYLAKRR